MIDTLWSGIQILGKNRGMLLVVFTVHNPFLDLLCTDYFVVLFRRWKGDKHQVTALCCSLDNLPLLLSAGRTIKLWNTEKREAIKVIKSLHELYGTVLPVVELTRCCFLYHLFVCMY